MDRSAAARQSLSINRSLVILLPTEVKLSSRGTVSKSAADFAALHESACGTSVWTGRALQAGSDELKIIGLALLYPALEWSVRAPGHHGYPRASVLIRV